MMHVQSSWLFSILQGQTGRFTVWLNGKQFRLVSFASWSCLLFLQISSLFRKTAAKARNWYQRYVWINGTYISLWNIPPEKNKKRKQDFFRCSVAHHGKFALERTIITRVSYTLATRKFRNLLANVIKPTICRSCCRRCRACLRSLLSKQTMNIHKIYLLWRVGFRHQRWDYQQLIVESSAK